MLAVYNQKGLHLTHSVPMVGLHGLQDFLGEVGWGGIRGGLTRRFKTSNGGEVHPHPRPSTSARLCPTSRCRETRVYRGTEKEKENGFWTVLMTVSSISGQWICFQSFHNFKECYNGYSQIHFSCCYFFMANSQEWNCWVKNTNIVMTRYMLPFCFSIL